MDAARTIPSSTRFLGSWPWCLALAWFGMKMGENWREMGKYFHKFDAIIGVVILAAVVWFVWSHWQDRIAPCSCRNFDFSCCGSLGTVFLVIVACCEVRCDSKRDSGVNSWPPASPPLCCA